MNRTIKFRAWQKYHKKMVEVTNISFDDNGEINGVATFVEEQLARTVWIHEMASSEFVEEIRESLKPEFLKLCIQTD